MRVKRSPSLPLRRPLPAQQSGSLKAIPLSWPLMIPFGLLACLALVWTAVGIDQLLLNRKYIELGKAVHCDTRPAYEYFAFCSPTADGPACSLEGRTRMMQWFDPIDYACAQGEPARPFVFPVSEPETLEIASVVSEG